MSQEGEKFITAETEGSKDAVRLKNEIQIALIHQRFGYTPELEQQIEWIQKYSAKFQSIFDRLIKEDPHFWLHDQETRNATLGLFEDELYAEEGKVNAEKVAENFDK